MHCGNVQARLSEYLDEFLSPRWRGEIETHLAQCPACRQMARELRRVRDAIDELSAVHAPERLASRIDRIPLEVSQDHSQFVLSGARMGWVAVAAAAAVILVVVRPMADSRGPAPEPMVQAAHHETPPGAVVEVRQLMLPEERQAASNAEWARVPMTRGVPLEGPQSAETGQPARSNEELIWQEVRQVSACSRRSF